MIMRADSAHLPTIVFDLDGTLADTAPDLIAVLNVILKQEGVAPISIDRARDVVGAGARAMIMRGLALSGREVSDQRLGELFRTFLDLYANALAVETTLFPGAREAIDTLAGAGYRLAICTNKYTFHSRQLLDALAVSDRFAAICGRDSFAWSKPDARHLTLTIEQAGGNPRHAIMVGDSRTDIDTARNAGLPVIAVSFGYTDTPVDQLGPDLIIDHFDALLPSIASLRAASAA
jgi:phosphoglycolate phosphatase